MVDENSWRRTATFRQIVVAKIEEAIRQSGVNTPKNSQEMEHHIFSKAKSKEEYLALAARIILHIRELDIQGKSQAYLVYVTLCCFFYFGLEDGCILFVVID
ncbi:mediator of RNA polymerase II transcription subunit 15-like [Diabrotica virgifera virgifera]|uniref:Mediator of RNA polymerase II transcription subunit 15 n=1 Tax=Diabrotica virgifera virgifera TaxID=50390 RepID=A0A6P7FCW3_DIAVI|nr:mediator of RNA polymerase II transcription subunit 15-like [Diabrotica virgifera virgifera]